MVEHTVDHNSGDTDEHPNGPDPSGESFVAGVSSLESSRHNDHDERGVHGRQNDVRDKDGKIQRTRPVMVRIGDRADVVVVNDVRGEEEDGGDESAGHHLSVTLPVSGPDPVITD